MIGEIDFKDIFHSDEDVLYPAITYIIFVIFLVVMSILIMNLLVCVRQVWEEIDD